MVGRIGDPEAAEADVAQVSNLSDVWVEQVMEIEPYASARRVFWVVGNGSSHRGNKSVERLRDRWPS
ncbi:hypothetical protein [Acidithrix ferrooxidans]|uniref:hypothetical protein n=1 Tax=Acidithrix ferrooxidans TaxID=1280514 RepID=UPI00190F2F2F|nr:hypothetical protein [Acidithrix ferrooxidans]